MAVIHSGTPPKMTRLARFEKSVLPHLDAAYNLARWLTRNDHDAQDVVQEAFLRAFRFFEGLQGGYREVLVMRELEELTYKEIATVAGIPIGTVMSRLARGRELLRRLI